MSSWLRLIGRAPLRATQRVTAQRRQFSTGPHHDLGGAAHLLEAPVPDDEPLHAWELEAHALYATLAKNGCFSTDETRRAIEAFAPGAYEKWGYYEKFVSNQGAGASAATA